MMTVQEKKFQIGDMVIGEGERGKIVAEYDGRSSIPGERPIAWEFKVQFPGSLPCWWKQDELKKVEYK